MYFQGDHDDLQVHPVAQHLDVAMKPRSFRNSRLGLVTIFSLGPNSVLKTGNQHSTEEKLFLFYSQINARTSCLPIRSDLLGEAAIEVQPSLLLQCQGLSR